MAKNPLRLQYNFADLMKFIAVFGLALSLFAWSGVGVAPGDESLEPLVMPVVMAFLVAVSGMVPGRRSSASCRICGRRYFPFRNAQPPDTCPRCRTAQLPPEQHRRLAFWGFVWIALLLLLLSTVLVVPTVMIFDDFSGETGWLASGALLIGTTALLFVLLVACIVVKQLLHVRRVGRPRYALQAAQTSSGDECEPESFGPITAWGFGAKAPSALLRQEFETSLGRFEALVGEKLELAQPLQVFAFAKRNAYERFLRRCLLPVSDHGGVFVSWKVPTAAFTTDRPAEPPSALETRLRTLFFYFMLDAWNGRSSPAWLQLGVAQALAADAGAAPRERLNRSMLASLARGTACGAAGFFGLGARGMYKLLRDQGDQEGFARSEQFNAQAWSLVDYLSGPDAPEGYAERFPSVLREFPPRGPYEAVFQRHYGCNSEQLLTGWRDWVLARGYGQHHAPSSEMRDALLDRILPLVRDTSATVAHRVRAVREMGRAGFTLGADELIALLRSQDARAAQLDRLLRILGNHAAPVALQSQALRELKEAGFARTPDALNRISRTSKEEARLGAEIVWALESISGLALGKDVEGWAEWWAGLTGETKLLASSPSPEVGAGSA